MQYFNMCIKTSWWKNSWLIYCSKAKWFYLSSYIQNTGIFPHESNRTGYSEHSKTLCYILHTPWFWRLFQQWWEPLYRPHHTACRTGSPACLQLAILSFPCSSAPDSHHPDCRAPSRRLLCWAAPPAPWWLTQRSYDSTTKTRRRHHDFLSECYTSVIIIFCLLTGMSNWTFSFCGSPFFNFTFMGFIARCPAPVLLHIVVTGGCPWTWIWPIKERDANKSVNKRKLVIHDHSDSIIELKERENKDIFWHFLWDWEKKGKKKMIKSREE